MASAGQKRRRANADSDPAPLGASLASLHDETTTLVFALQAALEALAASQISVAEDSVGVGAVAENVAETAARAACAARFDAAVRDVEVQSIAADGILERLQDARAEKAGDGLRRTAAARARADLDAFYEARVVDALTDSACPARQARTQENLSELTERLADMLAEKEAARVHQDTLFFFSADVYMSINRRSKGITTREIEELEDLISPSATAGVERVLRGDAHASSTIRKAVAMFGARLSYNPMPADVRELVERGKRSTLADFKRALRNATDATMKRAEAFHEFITHMYDDAVHVGYYDDEWPSGASTEDVRLFELWLCVLEEAHRRPVVERTRFRVLSQFEHARAVLPLLGSDSAELRKTAVACLAMATRGDLAQRGNDVASVCLEELARARRADAENVRAGAGPLEGGGGRRAARAPAHARRASPSKGSRLRSRSRSPSKPHPHRRLQLQARPKLSPHTKR